jgi:2-oxoglutarate ferredoxin oxidoreductase subunit alpha
VTTTSGPASALKSETIGLAISLELPLLIIDIQRGGPRPACPTKTEQSDLLLAMYGHHGESPVPIIAPTARRTASRSPSRRPASPSSTARRCIVLSDGYLANGAEPWLIPDVSTLPDISIDVRHRAQPRRRRRQPEFWPYLRDPRRWPARWRCRARRSLMHRIGGIEKADGSGNISYDPRTTSAWSRCGPPRSPASPATSPRPLRGDVDDAEILVIGWGSTWGAISGAVDRLPHRGRKVAQPTSAPQPVPPTSARSCTATQGCWCPR